MVGPPAAAPPRWSAWRGGRGGRPRGHRPDRRRRAARARSATRLASGGVQHVGSSCPRVTERAGACESRLAQAGVPRSLSGERRNSLARGQPCWCAGSASARRAPAPACDHQRRQAMRGGAVQQRAHGRAALLLRAAVRRRVAERGRDEQLDQVAAAHSCAASAVRTEQWAQGEALLCHALSQLLRSGAGSPARAGARKQGSSCRRQRTGCGVQQRLARCDVGPVRQRRLLHEHLARAGKPVSRGPARVLQARLCWPLCTSASRQQACDRPHHSQP